MATTDTTRIIIDLESRLRNLERTLRGLDQIKKRLDAIGGIKSQSQGLDRSAIAAQKLAQQQQRLVIQTQELANRQERARQTAERLAQSQQRLTASQQRLSQAQQRVTTTAGQQADAQVRAFRAIQRGFADANTHVRAFRANEAALRSAPQLDAHVRAFRAIQRGAEDANSHVLAFRANQRALARAPQMDAHVRAFRALEEGAQRATREQERMRRSTLTLEQSLGRVGGSLRNLGLGLVSLGASLSVALTAPLTALGVLSSRNAVTLDSLERGLTAITGSASEAGRQLSRLTEIAKLPGIGFQEAIQGSIRLQAVGFSAEVAERALVQFSNAVALTGGGREELSRITVQLGQLSAKGKVLAQDLKPIIEAGPAVGRALLQAFGTVNSEDIQALGLSSSQFIDKLLTQLEELPRAAAGLRNTFDNFSDAVFRASAAIGNAILPVLTRLIEVAEPIITRLANGFAKLPAPVQTLVVTFGALTAAAGPALFVLGQLATGIGGLVSSFGRLYTLGLIPTIAGFKLMIPVLRGTTAALTAQQAAAAATATTWTILGGAVAVGIAALTVAIIAFANSSKDAVKISKEQIDATQKEIDGLQDHLKFVNQLGSEVARTATEQDRLAQIYAELNTQAKVRLTAITDEEKRLSALREELEKLLKLRNEERVQQAANLAASLASTAQQIQANLDERGSIAARVQANVELAKAIAESGRITNEQSQQLARQGINASHAEEAIGALNAENESLIASQEALITAAKELNGTAEEQGQALQTLQQRTGLTARELLTAAKAMGLFKGNIETALASIERFSQAQVKAAKNTDIFTEALRKQNEELLRAGKSADEASKQRNDLIKSAASLAREASTSFEGALKFMRAFIAANPDLRAAIEKERQLAGKSFEDFIRDALGGDPAAQNRSAFRNAQQQLANALLDVNEAAAAKRAAVEKATNDTLLQANENAYRLQLISYQQYLRAREILTTKNLDLEIDATALAAKNSREAQIRLLAEAKKAGIPEAERTRRLAQAAAQEKAAIEAETRLVELENQRGQIAAETKATLAEASIQQLKDVRQLEIEYGELTGRIQAALDAATAERFRESLEALGKSQKFLNEQLQKAREAGNKEAQAAIERDIALNQRQIDVTENIFRQELATNALATANEFVRQQKEKQAELERQIGFEVEFRGLKEDEAIRRRLEGERKLADSLKVVRKLVQDEIDVLNAEGVKPPQALLDFIRDTNDAIRGLGELPFTEQFRLAEKEFNRLNDERISRIQDVERAVRNRTIAEVEGQILIRRINGEYAADLEAQLALLRQIAEESNNDSLRRQAEDAGETVKDTKDQVADLSTQIESAGKDAFRSGLTDFFNDLLNRTATAKDALLSFLNSITTAINDVISEQLSKELFESLFGGAEDAGGGLIAKIRGFFGSDGAGAAGSTVAGAATETAQATAAATALTTGAAAAAAALTTGGATASATLVTSLTAAAASFAAAVVAAGGAFAATVAASSAVQGLGGLGGSFAGAATGIFPAQPGGMIRIVEGGYPEAVITTDPKHAARQVGILRELIRRTRGFYGRVRIPELAAGGIVSRETVESNLLNSINRAPSTPSRLPDAALAGSGGRNVTLRQIFVDDQRDISNWYNSAEGDRVQVEWIARNRSTVKQLLGVRD